MTTTTVASSHNNIVRSNCFVHIIRGECLNDFMTVIYHFSKLLLLNSKSATGNRICRCMSSMNECWNWMSGRTTTTTITSTKIPSTFCHQINGNFLNAHKKLTLVFSLSIIRNSFCANTFVHFVQIHLFILASTAPVSCPLYPYNKSLGQLC